MEIRRREGRKRDGKDVKKGGGGEMRGRGGGDKEEGEREKRGGGRGIMSEGWTSWRPHDGICKYELYQE